MGHALSFADSFAHYDNAGIALKWTTGGGAISTSPLHLRMGGPQSLRIQAGDSPTKTLGGSGYTVIGVAWQTDVLSGESIFEQWAGPDRQLWLRQNADGSISLMSGVATLIATSAPGVITVGPFWYIEMASQLDPGFATVQAVVIVTSAAGVAVEVINEVGFATSQVTWDTLKWGGPAAANFAYLDSFYFADTWDGIGDPLAGFGAPKIYGSSVPLSDGVPYVGVFFPPQPVPFPDTGPPWWSLVNAIPEQTATFMLQNEVIVLGVEQGWPIVGRGFPVDVTAVPLGSTIAALQVCILYSFAAGDAVNFQGAPGRMIGRTGQSGVAFDKLAGNPVLASSPNGVLPFAYFTFGLSLDPQTGLAWSLPDFTGPTALQFGPYVAESA
jgi:hypothetical protein